MCSHGNIGCAVALLTTQVASPDISLLDQTAIGTDLHMGIAVEDRNNDADISLNIGLQSIRSFLLCEHSFDKLLAFEAQFVAPADIPKNVISKTR